MDQAFRVANADTSSTYVQVYVGNTAQGSPILLAPGESTRPSYPGLNNGPIRIVSVEANGTPNTKKIIAAMRVIWQEAGQRTSYTELMGLPKEQLSSEYWFPWYNNAATASMDQAFRVGMP
jgi:hypothetical protein